MTKLCYCGRTLVPVFGHDWGSDCACGRKWHRDGAGRWLFTPETEPGGVVRVVAGLLSRLTSDGWTSPELQVFMQRRPHAALRPGLWEYPGGKVERDEDDVTALEREWREELGLEVVVGECISEVALAIDLNLVMALYTVELADPHAAPVARDGQPGFWWGSPAVAVRHLPMSPGCYLFYRDVAMSLALPVKW